MESKDYSDNIPVIVSKLLRLFGIRVTFTTIKRTLRSHPDFPTLLSISESLTEWGIKTEAVQGTINDLSKADFPGIAHLKNNKFVVLKSIRDDEVRILDEGLRQKKYSLESFARIWSGIILRAISRQNAGEESYASNRKKVIFSYFKILSILIGLPLMLALAFLYGGKGVENAVTVTSLAMLKFGGFIFCLIMTLSSLRDGKFLLNLCPEGKSLNCHKVTSSPSGKIFGIYLSEMGMLYFAGGILSLLFSLFLKQADSNLYILSLLNVAVLPYAVFLLFNQAVVIRRWCWMCLMVQLFLWLEFYCLHIYISRGIRNILTILLPVSIFLGFSIPVLIWISLRSLIIRLNQSEHREAELLRMKRNPDYIQFQLNTGKRIGKANFPLEVEIGPGDAQVHLILVLNPLCMSCGESYRQIKKMIDLGCGHIKGIIRFLIGKTDNENSEKSLDYEVSLQIISAAVSENREALETVLDEWFAGKLRPKHTMPDQVLIEKSAEILKKHTAWARRFNITSTPTIIFNDIQLPAEIQFEDLKYYMMRQLAG